MNKTFGVEMGEKIWVIVGISKNYEQIHFYLVRAYAFCKNTLLKVRLIFVDAIEDRFN